jgi:hypothetical protein
MAVKANLRMILMADDVVVAESDDPQLWQAAFRAMTTGAGVGELDPVGATHLAGARDWLGEEEQLALSAFAEELGVEPAVVRAACSPRAIAPYVFPDKLHWEAFKKCTPERGRTAVSNIVLALTLLLLWAEKIRVERVTMRDGTAILRTIGARDEHPGRAVENCAWIERRMNRLVINPEEVSKAIAVARGYCLKRAPEWDESEGS